MSSETSCVGPVSPNRFSTFTSLTAKGGGSLKTKVLLYAVTVADPPRGISTDSALAPGATSNVTRVRTGGAGRTTGRVTRTSAPPSSAVRRPTHGLQSPTGEVPYPGVRILRGRRSVGVSVTSVQTSETVSGTGNSPRRSQTRKDWVRKPSVTSLTSPRRHHGHAVPGRTPDVLTST